MISVNGSSTEVLAGGGISGQRQTRNLAAIHIDQVFNVIDADACDQSAMIVNLRDASRDVSMLKQLPTVQKKNNLILYSRHAIDQVSTKLVAEPWKDSFPFRPGYRANIDHLIGDDSQWTATAVQQDDTIG